MELAEIFNAVLVEQGSTPVSRVKIAHWAGYVQDKTFGAVKCFYDAGELSLSIIGLNANFISNEAFKIGHGSMNVDGDKITFKAKSMHNGSHLLDVKSDNIVIYMRYVPAKLYPPVADTHLHGKVRLDSPDFCPMCMTHFRAELSKNVLLML